MPSAAVRDEGALQMRPAPRGYSSALLCDPISFSLPEKEMGSPAKGKEGCAKPEVHPVPASRQKKAVPFRFRRGGESSTSAASFFLPKLRPFTGSQFGFRGFRRATRYLDDGGHLAFYGYALQGRAGSSAPTTKKEPPVRWIGRGASFYCSAFCF